MNTRDDPDSTCCTWLFVYLTQLSMKRGRSEVEEFEDVTSISHISPNAKVSGVVSCISPMKESKNCSYFDGNFTDGKASLRLFGFDSSVRRKLVESGYGASITISNCEVKKSRIGEELEVSCVHVHGVRILDDTLPV